MKYLVSHQGEQTGPYSLDEIVRGIRGKQLELFDYIFDPEKDDWVLLMEFAPVAAKLKSGKPSGRPAAVQAAESHPAKAAGRKPTGAPRIKATADEEPVSARIGATAHTVSDWFVLKGENRFGPFTYLDLVKMLQGKVVFPFDFAWHAGLVDWKRIAELPDFSQESIRALFAGAGGQETFVQRRFKRKPFSGRVIIHDNLHLWKGQALEISQGGVGVTMSNTLIVPGQQLTLHFSAQGELPAFNALCEVVSKKFVSDSSPVEYGMRFLSLSQEMQDEFRKKVA